MHRFIIYWLQIHTNIPKISDSLIDLISWKHNIGQYCKAKSFTVKWKLGKLAVYSIMQSTRSLYSCTTGSLKISIENTRGEESGWDFHYHINKKLLMTIV